MILFVRLHIHTDIHTHVCTNETGQGTGTAVREANGVRPRGRGPPHANGALHAGPRVCGIFL